MIQGLFSITEIEFLTSTITKIKFEAPAIAKTAKQGQFVNIKVEDSTVPLLRRPFSVYNTNGSEIEIVFGVMGMGTKKLNNKKIGDLIDVIGPLGNPFNIHDVEDISILIGGGLGAAPLPLLYKNLVEQNKKVLVFIGARTKEYLLKKYLHDPIIATDDGSEGYKGDVVSLLNGYILKNPQKNYKIYACGPTPMLIAIVNLAKKFNIKCEISLETMMACGIGICQGCAVKVKNEKEKYALSCINGPVFSASDIEL